MKHFKWFYVCAIFLVIIACLTDETEARRKIIKGRHTVNQRYYRSAGIPAWAIILLVALGEILVGVAMFFVMKRLILDPELTGNYSPENLRMTP